MPHRTTYFFPRQFPDRGFDASSKVFQDHEKKISKESFNGDSDGKASKISKEVTVGGKSTTVSDRFTGDKILGKQLAAFVNWLAEKKGDRSGHVKVRLDGGGDDHEHELLLPLEPPEAVVAGKVRRSDREESLQRLSSGTRYGGPPEVVGAAGEEQGFDRQVSLQRLSSGSSYGGPPVAPEVVGGGKERGFDRLTSLQRLSSGSSYAGSLFSGMTLDGNLSSGVKNSHVSTTRQEEEEEEEERRDVLAQRSRESYYLQLTHAKRLTEQASLASEPLFQQQCGVEGLSVSPDAETVSYRLWVLSLSVSLSLSLTLKQTPAH